TQPVAHHVRSDRNTIVVDFDKPTARAAAYVAAAPARRAPDAMLALARVATPTVDPIAALGLDKRNDKLAAQTAGSATIRATRPQPPAGQPVAPPPDQVGSGRGDRKFTGHPV